MKKPYKEQIAELYKKRNKAHRILLECDEALDNLLKKLVKELEE